MAKGVEISPWMFQILIVNCIFFCERHIISKQIQRTRSVFLLLCAIVPLALLKLLADCVSWAVQSHGACALRSQSIGPFCEWLSFQWSSMGVVFLARMEAFQLGGDF